MGVTADTSVAARRVDGRKESAVAQDNGHAGVPTMRAIQSYALGAPLQTLKYLCVSIWQLCGQLMGVAKFVILLPDDKEWRMVY